MRGRPPGPGREPVIAKLGAVCLYLAYSVLVFGLEAASGAAVVPWGRREYTSRAEHLRPAD